MSPSWIAKNWNGTQIPITDVKHELLPKEPIGVHVPRSCIRITQFYYIRGCISIFYVGVLVGARPAGPFANRDTAAARPLGTLSGEWRPAPSRPRTSYACRLDCISYAKASHRHFYNRRDRYRRPEPSFYASTSRTEGIPRSLARWRTSPMSSKESTTKPSASWSRFRTLHDNIAESARSWRP